MSGTDLSSLGGRRSKGSLTTSLTISGSNIRPGLSISIPLDRKDFLGDGPGVLLSSVYGEYCYFYS